MKKLRDNMSKEFIRKNKEYLSQLATAISMIKARNSALAYRSGQAEDLTEFMRLINGVIANTNPDIVLSLDRVKALAMNANELNAIIVTVDTGIIELLSIALQLDKVPNGKTEDLASNN